jgi:predicted transglutaminase-like cysteine proteinase
MSVIEDVFNRVRQVFVWTADKEVFSVDEHWTSFKHMIDAGAHYVRDDCDAFAMTCLDLLADAGVPRDRLRAIECDTEQGERHLVAGVDHDTGTWILDNRQRRVLDYSTMRGYRWLRSMHLSEAGTWRHIGVAT